MSDPGFDWGLLNPLSADSSSTALCSDDGVLRALLHVESALTLAWHDLGVAPEAVVGLADRVASAHPDRDMLLSGGGRDGNPVVALVGGLRAGAPEGLGEWIHRGATSQDIVDTALMLVAERTVADVRRGLSMLGMVLAEKADEFRATPAVARTLGQHAGPTTFGVTVAGWLDSVVAARAALSVLDFPVQLGGSVGTGLAVADLSGTADTPEQLRAAFAARLELADPGRSWHTERTVILQLAAALAGAVGALGRIGAQLSELSRTEIGEVHVGTGASSAMPHKQNPVGPILLVAAAHQAPGLLATLASSLVAVDERPPGAWHAEWPALRSLLRLTVDAVHAALAAVAGSSVDVLAMARNLALTDGLVNSESALNQLTRQLGPSRARELVDQAIENTRDDVSFAEALAATDASAHLALPSPLLGARADRIIEASLARLRAATPESES